MSLEGFPEGERGEVSDRGLVGEVVRNLLGCRVSRRGRRCDGRQLPCTPLWRRGESPGQRLAHCLVSLVKMHRHPQVV